MTTNLLFLSAGRRVKLLNNARQSLQNKLKIVAADMNPTAPALYVADKKYIVPQICDKGYIDCVIEICKRENIHAITTLIDPEIEILSNNRCTFEEMGITVLAPDSKTAKICFNKYEMFKFLSENAVPTPLTFHSLCCFKEALIKGEISFPVFIKPISGSGSVGAHKINSMTELEYEINLGKYDYIIQEYMPNGDCNADVYVDTISNMAVSAFCKRKIETQIGGANKTVSFMDEKLFRFISDICNILEFSGPVDMDFFYKDGKYHLSDINPRFGGAYLHAYGAGVDFFKLIQNNINGFENTPSFGNYEEGIVMMMYDDVVICKNEELINQNFSVL